MEFGVEVRRRAGYLEVHMGLNKYSYKCFIVGVRSKDKYSYLIYNPSF